MKQRINYLDIAKGILILIMVFHHVTLLFPKGENDLYVNFYDEATHIYGSFFMVAFFIISGFCSNFNKKLVDFLRSNIKGIFLPYLVLSIISRLIESFVYNDINKITGIFSLEYWLLLSDYWFFTTLFICKIAVWYLSRIPEKFRFFEYCILLVVSIYGVFLNPVYDPTNYFCYKHVLISLIFVFIGYDLKKIGITNKMASYGAILFVMLQILRILLHRPSPQFAWCVGMNVYQYPIFLILSLSGTCLIIYISKLINKSLFWEYFGANSAVVYGLNMPFIRLGYFFIFKIIKESPYFLLSVSYSLVCFIFVLACSAFMIYLFRLRYMRVLIGK